jgi:hypothetical protein
MSAPECKRKFLIRMLSIRITVSTNAKRSDINLQIFLFFNYTVPKKQKFQKISFLKLTNGLKVNSLKNLWGPKLKKIDSSGGIDSAIKTNLCRNRFLLSDTLRNRERAKY